MFTFLAILAILICLFLILFILIQNPKGGGLSSSFGASNQIMGVQKTGDFLERTTWGLAIALLVICLSMKVFSPGTGKSSEPLEIQKAIERNPSGNASGFGGTAPSRNTKPGTSPAAVPSSPAPSTAKPTPAK